MIPDTPGKEKAGPENSNEQQIAKHPYGDSDHVHSHGVGVSNAHRPATTEEMHQAHLDRISHEIVVLLADKNVSHGDAALILDNAKELLKDTKIALSC